MRVGNPEPRLAAFVVVRHGPSEPRPPFASTAQRYSLTSRGLSQGFLKRTTGIEPATLSLGTRTRPVDLFGRFAPVPRGYV
jgi:hypothetical protein